MTMQLKMTKRSSSLGRTGELQTSLHGLHNFYINRLFEPDKYDEGDVNNRTRAIGNR